MDLSNMDGMFVGLLDADEIDVLNRAVKDGKAYRSYEGGGGLMGLAKVRLIRPMPTSNQTDRE